MADRAPRGDSVKNAHLAPLREPEKVWSGVLEMLSASAAYLDYVEGQADSTCTSRG